MRFDLELRQPLEHVGAHVREDEPLRSDLAAVLHERPVVEVERDAFLVEIGLADEEVASLGCSGESFGPLGVPGVRENSARVLESKRVRGSAARVADFIRRHGEGAESARELGLHLDDPGLEFSLDPRGARKEDLHRLRQSLGCARRAGYEKRTLAARELGIEKEERNPSEVVPVEVAHHDDVNGGRVDRRSLQPDESRRSAVHQSAKSIGVDEYRCLESSAASKRVAASEETDGNRRAHSGSVSGGSGRKKLRKNPPK